MISRSTQRPLVALALAVSVAAAGAALWADLHVFPKAKPTRYLILSAVAVPGRPSHIKVTLETDHRLQGYLLSVTRTANPRNPRLIALPPVQGEWSGSIAVHRGTRCDRRASINLLLPGHRRIAAVAMPADRSCRR